MGVGLLESKPSNRCPKFQETKMFARRCLQGLVLFGFIPAVIGCASPSLISIQITPDTETFIGGAGGTAQFKAIGTYEQGEKPQTTQDVTDIVTWSSNTTGVATMSATGVVTATGFGSAEITATGHGFTGLITAYAQAIVCHASPTDPDACVSN